MSAKKEDLGKGIRALLGGINDDMKANPEVAAELRDKVNNTSVLLENIEVNPFQPRAALGPGLAKWLGLTARTELSGALKIRALDS